MMRGDKEINFGSVAQLGMSLTFAATGLTKMTSLLGSAKAGVMAFVASLGESVVIQNAASASIKTYNAEAIGSIVRQQFQNEAIGQNVAMQLLKCRTQEEAIALLVSETG